MIDGGNEGDPFAGLQLDESFVKGAGVREPTAADRERQARRLAEQEAEERARRKAARRARRPHRRLARALRGPGVAKAWVVVLVVGAVIGWAMWSSRPDDDKPPPGEPSSAWESAEPIHSVIPASEVHPTLSPPPSREPLSTPPPRPKGNGPYVFMDTQKGSAAPVTYDPCRPISIVVNERTMPDGARGVVEEAVAAVAEATGLQLRVEGPTDERPDPKDRAPFQPDRYGDRWAPVLLAWSDPAEDPFLEGAVAGRGGSTVLAEVEPGVDVYVTGEVTLDGPQIATILEADDGRAQAKAIVLHELAHLVGLDHVNDPTQLMNPVGGEVVDFAAGDLLGLRQLNSGTCIALL